MAKKRTRKNCWKYFRAYNFEKKSSETGIVADSRGRTIKKTNQLDQNIKVPGRVFLIFQNWN